MAAGTSVWFDGPRWSDSAPRRWPALDGLRAIAVALVLVGHIAQATWIASVGVELFYVLSGFLISWLLLQEWDAAGRIGFGRFFARRALRIFPAFYVSLAITAVTLRGTPDMPPPSLWLAAGTYTADYYLATHPHPGSALAHTWSLAVEEQFYLLWPAALTLLLRRGRGWAHLGVAAVVVAVSLWRFWVEQVIQIRPTYLYFAFDTRFDFLAVGSMLAIGWGIPGYRERLARLAASRWSPVVTWLLIAAVVVTLDRDLRYASSFPLKAVLLGLMVAQLLLLSKRGFWTTLDLPVLRWLGALSYSLYLYHFLAWLVAGWVTEDLAPRVAIAVSAALVASIGSYYLVERPVLRWRDRRFPADQGRRRGHGTASVVALGAGAA